ncbi:hypothetical protein D3C71_1302920 [compost metagenome]
MVVDSSRLFQVMMPNLRFTNSSVKFSQCSVVGIQIGGLMKISLISLSDELNSQNSGNRVTRETTAIRRKAAPEVRLFSPERLALFAVGFIFV